MITKKYWIDFKSFGGALTLEPAEVSESEYALVWVLQERTHPDGWTIKGIVYEDYYWWVNDFEATHPDYWKVWGNFEKEVYADSEEGYNHFYKSHKPLERDYMDI